jgi:asparagine synthase (glutamine-hydrolysing)
MPGIVGLIANDTVKKDPAALGLMLKCMLHEPFYTSGTYVHEGLGLHIGWVNRHGSFSDCMPVWNETNDICLIFYGENFPEKELTGRLKSQGHKFSPSNAGYLVHLYEEQEDDFLGLLNGWFSGVLVDLRKDRVILFNDRYGMQRIYCYESKDAFYFSSEAKSLLRVCPELRELDMKSLGEVFSFGCVLENRTLFPRISLLPPGSAWSLGKGGVRQKDQYFQPDTWERQPPLDKESFYKQFRETFVSILPKYFEAPSKMALSLTGGLDTRMILANMDLHRDQLPCYTFGGMYRHCYDVKLAREIAEVCNQSHQIMEVGKKFFPEFPALAEKAVYVSDGNFDVASGSVELYINKLAREIAPVRLTGNYGSEIMRGARHLKAKSPCKGLFTGWFEKHIIDAADTLRIHHQDHRVSFAAFKQAPWHHYNRLALEQSQLTLRSPYLDNDLVGLMFKAPPGVINSSELSFYLINEGSPQLGGIMTDRGLGGNKGYLISNWTYLYREFLFKADYAFNYGMPQWLARLDHWLLAPLQVERLFLGQHKFFHFRIWYRDELSGYVKKILLDPRSLERPYLNGRFVEKMVQDHTSGRLNYTTEITQLLTLELLQRVLIDQQ